MGEPLKVGPAVFCLAVSRTKTCGMKQRGFARSDTEPLSPGSACQGGVLLGQSLPGVLLCQHPVCIAAPDLPGQEKRSRPRSTPRSNRGVSVDGSVSDSMMG